MSISEFEPWLRGAFRGTGGFTALIVLVKIGDDTVKALSSTYVHLIGDELTWPEFSALIAKSGVKWDGVAIFQEWDEGPIPDAMARVKLREREVQIADDPACINEGNFFDIWGRRMKVEEATRQ